MGHHWTQDPDEYAGGQREAERQAIELECHSLEEKTKIFLGVLMYRDCEVRIPQVELHHEVAVSEQGASCVKSFHFEFLLRKKPVQAL